jgi:hypothetical protein
LAIVTQVAGDALALFADRSPRANYLVNWSRRFRYIYVETPKVGCTSIKRMLQHAEVDGDDSRLHWESGPEVGMSGGRVHDKELSPLMSPLDSPAEFLEALGSEAFLRFGFVRNPFSRVLSAYLDKVVGNPWERQRHLPAFGFDPDDDVRFGEVVRAIVDRDPVELDPHWAPQFMLLSPDRIEYALVGRFERLEADLLDVATRLGLVDSFHGAVQIPPHATGASSLLGVHYSPEVVDLVREYYRVDFDAFSYSARSPLTR